MPRPQNNRIVKTPPLYKSFKPVGLRSKSLSISSFSLDEFEAIRLADYIGLQHEAAAVEMEISRPTFTRLIDKARKKMAKFIIEGQVLNIEGGKIHFRQNIFRCLTCGHEFTTDFDQETKLCPSCKSENLLNLARDFGHGKCCRIRTVN